MNKIFVVSCMKASWTPPSLSIFRCSRHSSQYQKLSSRSYYDILGVAQSATENEIKAAFYDKSKIYHPDSQQDSATKNDSDFLAICAAYETLKKQDARRQYDFFLNSKRPRNANFQHPTNHPVYSKDFVKWRDQYGDSHFPRNWKYSHEQGEQDVDFVSLIYFAIFCGIVSFIAVSEKLRRERKVVVYRTKYSTHDTGKGSETQKSRPREFFPATHVSHSKKDDSYPKRTISDEKSRTKITKNDPTNSTSSPENSFSDLKSWK